MLMDISVNDMKSLFPLVMSLFLVFVDSISLPTLGHPQSIAVHGLLKCNGKPMPDVKVKLYDDDAGIQKYFFFSLGPSGSSFRPYLRI